MIIVSFVLFALLIFAWLAAPDKSGRQFTQACSAGGSRFTPD